MKDNLRRKHSPNFKANVVLEVLREADSLSELSSKHGIHPNLVSKWRQQALDNLPMLFREKGQSREKDELIEELYSR